MREHQQYLHHIDTAGPERDDSGRVIYNHATEIPYNEGAALWQRRIDEIRLMDGTSSHQVVVIPTNDLTRRISQANCYPFVGKNRVATVTVSEFPDKREDLVTIENEVPGVKHVTIIASPVTYTDLFHTMQVADHYREVLGTEHITLLSPGIMTPRQDKNTDSSTGSYRPVSINIHTTMNALCSSIDSFIAMEPHSFATQTEAAKRNKALLPVTPWRYLMEEARRRGVMIDGQKFVFSKENTVNARPDKGRNIAATRSANFYNLDHVSFDKTRISPKETAMTLSIEEQSKVRGKMCVVYDDEVSTFSTMGTMAKMLSEYQALGLIIVAVNGKFTEEWEASIANPIIKKIFVSDSIEPVGKIEPYIKSGKIEVVSLDRNVAEILDADLRGVNFWLDPNYCHMILQTNGQGESC